MANKARRFQANRNHERKENFSKITFTASQYFENVVKAVTKVEGKSIEVPFYIWPEEAFKNKIDEKNAKNEEIADFSI